LHNEWLRLMRKGALQIRLDIKIIRLHMSLNKLDGNLREVPVSMPTVIKMLSRLFLKN
jgi:hypothetical protein